MNKRFISIRTKLLVSFGVFLLALGVINFMYYLNASQIEASHRESTAIQFLYRDLELKNSEMNQALENFITTQNTNYVDDIFNLQNEFLDTLEMAKHSVHDEQMQLYLSNISEIFYGGYIQSTDDTIWAVRGVDPDKLETHYKEVIKFKGYMDEYINILYDSQAEQNKIAADALRHRTKQLVNNNLMVTIWSLLFAGFIFYMLGWRIVKNITKLNEAALAVSQGDFDQKVDIDSNDELSLLADTFNNLTTNTKDHIQQIKRTAEIESLLREAELLSLQSQINPHFLFNTLNVVAKTAIIEDAEQTCTLIECVSDMLRYNLKKLNEISTLHDEISNVENYIYIQKTRFGNRVNFDLDIAPEIKSISIPNLTLQPLVENAFIHGIEDIEEGGWIRIYAQKLDENIIELCIEDNGRGISEERMRKILMPDGGAVGGHTTGIGVNNVKRRLELFLNSDDVFEIESRVGEGTKITIRLNSDIEGAIC